MSKNPHEFQRQGKYLFSPAEIDEMKNSLAPKAVQIRGHEREAEMLKSEIKKHTTSIDHLRGEIADDAKKIEDGYEWTQVTTIRFKSYRSNAWIFVNKSTWEMVTQEPFGMNDTQRQIGELIWPPDNGKVLGEVMANLVSQEAYGIDLFDGGVSTTFTHGGKSVTIGKAVPLDEPLENESEAEEDVPTPDPENEKAATQSDEAVTESTDVQDVKYEIDGFPLLHMKSGVAYVDSCDLEVSVVVNATNKAFFKRWRNKYPTLTDDDIEECKRYAATFEEDPF